ncbi:MAG: fibronectin type III domain-containing protein [Candidatus Zambryskibacteria bacterium]
MKKLNSVFLAIVMSFYGITAMSPSLVFADNSSNGKNEVRQEVKQVKQEIKQAKQDMKQEIKQMKENVKSSFSWGSFMSSIRSRSNPNKFFDWFWGNKNYHNNDSNDNKDEDNNGGQQNNGNLRINNINAVPSTTTAIVSWNTNQPTQGSVLFGLSSSTLTSTVSESAGPFTLSHQVTLNILAPNTKYFYVIKTQNASSTIVQSNVRNFKTLTTTTPVSDTTPPTIVFATNLGLSASTTSVIWVTNEASDSKIWFSTTAPVATTTSPMASSGTLSYFHQLNLSGLATSTLYYYTISSTDASSNTSYYSTSFTSPSI